MTDSVQAAPAFFTWPLDYKLTARSSPRTESPNTSDSMHEKDCQRLSLVRLEDAQVLLGARRFSAAYYVAGYSIELALKAVIATRFVANDIPPADFVQRIYTHAPDKLIDSAGLKGELNKRSAQSRQFAGNWGVVRDWSPESRYEAVDQVAAELLLRAIVHDKERILPWIRSFWTKAESKPA